MLTEGGGVKTNTYECVARLIYGAKEVAEVAGNIVGIKNNYEGDLLTYELSQLPMLSALCTHID